MSSAACSVVMTDPPPTGIAEMSELHAFEIDQIGGVVPVLCALLAVVIGADARNEDIMHLIFARTLDDLVTRLDAVQVGVARVIVREQDDVCRLLGHRVAGVLADGVDDDRRLVGANPEAVMAEPSYLCHIPQPGRKRTGS